MNKTTYRFSWENGFVKTRRMTRSFDTLEEATEFSKGKDVIDIYRSNGKYTVEWVKTTGIYD